MRVRVRVKREGEGEGEGEGEVEGEGLHACMYLDKLICQRRVLDNVHVNGAVRLDGNARQVTKQKRHLAHA